MSFFKDLKDDFMQAVNELGDEAVSANGEETGVVEESPMEVSSDENLTEEEPVELVNEETEEPIEEHEEVFEEESVEEFEEIPVEEPAEESDEEPVEEPVEESDEEPVEAPVEALVEELKEEKSVDEAPIDYKEETRDMLDDKVEEVLTGEAKPDDVTVITKGTIIRGGIASDGSLEVMGTISGDVECQGKLTIVGTVNGNSKAAEIYVNTPRLEGNMQSEGSVKIGVGTVVIGDVSAHSAVIAGALKGNVDVNGPVVIDSTAIVQGDINAKSLQVNSGAVIEGKCSLGYADIDLNSFFMKEDK